MHSASCSPSLKPPLIIEDYLRVASAHMLAHMRADVVAGVRFHESYPSHIDGRLPYDNGGRARACEGKKTSE